MEKKYRIIVYGGRDFDDFELLLKEMREFVKEMDFNDIEVVSGACSDKKGKLTFIRPDGTEVYGADGLGERFAAAINVPCKYFPADWNKYGNSAGPIRNSEMAKYATHAKGFWDGVSRGTRDMSKKASKLIGDITFYKPKINE